MDAIRKIEAALKKMPGDGPWRPEHRDALTEWRALMNEATIREVLQTLASKEAELAEAGLKYVSLFGELQGAMEQIALLRKRLTPFARFTCSPPGECSCHNCLALQLAVADAWENYERMGSVCEFEGQPMIYASTLEEIHDAAAHREQGVEAAGAVERKWPFDGEEIGPRMFLASNPGATHEQVTAPPSSKTQDDLAGAGVEGVLTNEQLADLVPDGFEVIGEGKEKRTALTLPQLRQFVANVLTSQPNAPAPVPVVQGEAQIEAVCRELCHWDQQNPDEVLDSRPEGDKLMWQRQEGKALAILTAARITPPGGAGGEVGARIGQLEKVSTALIRLDAIYRDLVDTEVTPSRPTWLRDALHIAEALATPAPEQATTGSGQGVTDAERLDFMLAHDAFVVSVKLDHPVIRYQCWNQDEDEVYHTLSGENKSFATKREAIDAAILSTASPAGEGKS